MSADTSVEHALVEPKMQLKFLGAFLFLSWVSIAADAAQKTDSYVVGTRSYSVSRHWVPLNLSAGEVAQSVRITRISARGDVDFATSSEYVDFRVAGATSFIRVDPNSKNCDWAISEPYSSTQPTLTSVNGVEGFYVELQLGSGTNVYYCGSSNYADIKITYDLDYSPDLNTKSIGGSLSGMGAGKTVILQNSNGERLSLTSNGGFTFPTRVANGYSYTVSVFSQPSGEECTITNGSGVADSDVTDIAVACADPFELVIGESKTLDSLQQGADLTYTLDATSLGNYSAIRIGTRGGTGDVDLFVGDGFTPTPYQQFTCKSENAGNTESCDLTPPGFYYAKVFGFSAAQKIEIYAQALGRPDAPVADKAVAGDQQAQVYFASSADNGAAITDFAASCQLVTSIGNTLGEGEDLTGSRETLDWRFSPVAIEDAPNWVEIPPSATLVRGPVGGPADGAPKTLRLPTAQGELSLEVTQSRVTPSDNLYMTGNDPDGGEFRALLTPDGTLIGEVERENGILLISPSQERGISVLQDSTGSGLQPLPFGEDFVVPPPRGGTADSEENLTSLTNNTAYVVDVLMLVSPTLSGGSSTADYLLQYTNDIHARSGTGVTFVATTFRSYSANTSNPLSDISSSETVRRWRDSDRADLVAWVDNLAAQYDYCGVAYVPGVDGADFNGQLKSNGFSVTLYGSYSNYFCNNDTLAHELGHNMGALHDIANSYGYQPYLYYAFGDGRSGQWGTVQSYISPRSNKFSSPDLTCAGVPCGQANYTDVVRALKNVKQRVANIYEGNASDPALPAFSISPGAGHGGRVSPVTPQQAQQGSTVSFSLTPDTGYKVESVVGSCNGNLSGNAYVVTVGDSDCSFEAAFVPSGKYYSVNVTATSGGQVEPLGVTKVTPFDQLNIDIQPAPGFAIVEIDASCPGSYSGGVFYTGDIVSDCSVAVFFARSGNVANRNRSPITVPGLSAGAEYECKVTATNSYGVSNSSNGVLVTPFLATAPGRPVINNIVSEDGELVVYFTPGSSGGLAVTYTVTCGENSVSSSQSPITVTGLQNDVPVECTVTATNSRGSVTSSIVVATPEEVLSGLPIWLLYQATQP